MIPISRKWHHVLDEELCNARFKAKAQYVCMLVLLLLLLNVCMSMDTGQIRRLY